MKPLRFLTLVVSHLILFLIALNCLLSGLWGIRLDPVAQFLPLRLVTVGGFMHRVYWLGALAVVVLYWVLTVIVWRQRPGALRVRTASGDNLLIHPGAILKFVRLQVDNHPAVVSSKIRVRQSGSRGLSVKAVVMIRPIASLPEIKRELESAIRDGMSQVMGIEKIDDIQIVLGLDEKELNYKPGSLVKAQPAPEPPPRSADAAAVVEDDEAGEIAMKHGDEP